MAHSIPQVISEVLRQAGRPLTSSEIYSAICERRLYDFKAKDPASIVRSQLRRYSIGAKSPGARLRIFQQVENGAFELLPSPVKAES